MKTAGGIALATLGWAFTFAVPWGNFWLKIGSTIVVLCLYVFLFQRPHFRLRFSSLALGILSAIALYGVFFVGNIAAPWFLPGAAQQIQSIYNLGPNGSTLPVMLLLLFITGPGEEIFWRGFVQENLMERWGPGLGLLAATLLYAAVHIFSMNPMLIIAALVAGFLWGVLYLYTKDIVMLIISHSLWSITIFVVAPLTNNM